MALRQDWEFRGLVYQSTDPALLDYLGAGGRTAYIGFDPTASSLHLGSLLQLCNLRRLQEAGNRPVALAGGGTGLIGDPSFKDAERRLLDADELAANLEGIRTQLERFLDFSPAAGAAQAVLADNATWLTSISVTDFLRQVGKHFTVNQMVAKESVRSRLDRPDSGLSFTEFTYMLLQAYDFLELHRRYDCTVQLGGSDQWGNITMGAELVHKVTGHSAYGLTSPLLVRSDGRKYGKSEGGNERVWLDAEMTSPFALHQFLLNSEDALVPTLLRFFTFLDHDTIAQLDVDTREYPAERRGQRALANAVVALVHGEHAAAQADRAGRALFSEEIADLDEKLLLAVVADAPSSTIARERMREGVGPVDLLVETGLAASRAQARRFLDQGGVYINNVRAVADQPVDLTQALHGRYVVLRRGPRQLHLVVVA